MLFWNLAIAYLLIGATISALVVSLMAYAINNFPDEELGDWMTVASTARKFAGDYWFAFLFLCILVSWPGFVYACVVALMKRLSGRKKGRHRESDG